MRSIPRSTTLWFCVSLVVVLLALIGAPLHAFGDERIMPPDGSALSQAVKAVRDGFGKELSASQPTELQQAAEKLLKLVDTEADATTRYAMLMEAAGAAIKAEKIELTLAILEKQAALFRVDLRDLRTDAYLLIGRSAKDPAVHQRLVELNLSDVEALITSGDYEIAERQVRATDASLAKAKDASLNKRVVETSGQINTFRREQQAYQIVQTKLLEKPDDPDANLAVGRYLCFFKGDWAKGLPHLAKGRDPMIAAAAKSDIAMPEQAEAQAASGALWWDTAEKQSGRVKEAMQQRASFWYESALPSLTGLAKTVAEKRIEAVAKMLEASTTARVQNDRKPINLLAEANGARDSVTGRWSVENGEVTCPTDSWARFKFPHKLEADEFDVTIEFTRHKGDEGFGIVVVPNGKHVHFGMGSINNTFISVGEFKADDPQNPKHVRVPIGPNGKKQQAKFQFRKNSLTTWLNGKMVLHYKTDFSEIGDQKWGFSDGQIGLVSWYNSITFHKAELQVVGKSGK